MSDMLERVAVVVGVFVLAALMAGAVFGSIALLLYFIREAGR
jgi:hypothetical protein